MNKVTTWLHKLAVLPLDSSFPTMFLVMKCSRAPKNPGREAEHREKKTVPDEDDKVIVRVGKTPAISRAATLAYILGGTRQKHYGHRLETHATASIEFECLATIDSKRRDSTGIQECLLSNSGRPGQLLSKRCQVGRLLIVTWSLLPPSAALSIRLSTLSLTHGIDQVDCQR